MFSTGSKIAAAVIIFCLALFNGVATADVAVLNENFQTTPTGPLGSPWEVTSGGASTAVVVDTPDHGRVLNLRGSKTIPEFLTATRHFSSAATEVQFSYAVNPSAGSSFQTELNGTGNSYFSRHLRLFLDPGSNTLQSLTSPSGITDCGPLARGTWSTITLRVHETVLPHTFDVLINGARTNCTGLETRQASPFTGISVLDGLDTGQGGSVLFDNFLVTAL
jgi:hypothetical protein